MADCRETILTTHHQPPEQSGGIDCDGGDGVEDGGDGVEDGGDGVEDGSDGVEDGGDGTEDGGDRGDKKQKPKKK